MTRKPYTLTVRGQKISNRSQRRWLAVSVREHDVTVEPGQYGHMQSGTYVAYADVIKRSDNLQTAWTAADRWSGGPGSVQLVVDSETGDEVDRFGTPIRMSVLEPEQPKTESQLQPTYVCTCRYYDDGDGESGPHLAVDADEQCPEHGRAADPDGWAEQDAMWPDPEDADRRAGHNGDTEPPPNEPERRTIRTEDGVEVGEGDQVYGFHSQMCVGTIRVGSISAYEERKDEYHGPLMQGSLSPWFTVDFENGKSELLNGQRVASVEGARRMGYLS